MLYHCLGNNNNNNSDYFNFYRMEDIDDNNNDEDMGDAFMERLQMIQRLEAEEDAEQEEANDIPARGRVRRLGMRRMALWERQHRHRRARLEMERERLFFEQHRRHQVQLGVDNNNNNNADPIRNRELELLREELAEEIRVEADLDEQPLVLARREARREAVMAAMMRPNQNNNNPENDNNNPNNNNQRADVDDDFDDVLMMAQGGLEGRISALRAALESVPSGLFEMVQEGRVCKSVLSGWGRTEENSCQCIVQHCTNNPEEAQYVSRAGRTPLHEACLRGACRHVIRALLEATNHRASKERDFQGNTPLHLLFVDYSSDHLHNRNLVWSPEDLSQVVGDLLSFNPQVIASSTNSDGDTPLHSACMAPETMVDPSSIVQLLRANPRAASRLNRKNQTPLRIHCQRRNASPEVAGLLLQENAHALIQLDSEQGWAPIHAAASDANFELLRYLVQSFAESVKVQTAKRQTVLHLLCQHHTHLSSVGPSPSLPSNNTNHHNTSANRSHQNNNGSIPNVEAAVEFLLRADPEAIRYQDTIDGCTPLHLVCKTEGSRQVPLPVVRLLLGCNRAAANIPDEQQYLPLHHACEMGSSFEVISALVEAYPEATRALTHKGDSALSLACTANKSTDTIKLLLANNTSVLKQTNDYGFCPLHCVCRAHQPRMGIVQALVNACPETVNLQTNSGETPFHLASSNTGAFVGVLQLLAQTQTRLGGSLDAMDLVYANDNSSSPMVTNDEQKNLRTVTSNKMGNTPRK